MNPMPRNHRSGKDAAQDEQDLIAFHLGEPCDEQAMRIRLAADADFAALSEEIAHTLRVFSADPVPVPDTETAWQRLRGTLPLLAPPARTRRWWVLTPTAAIAMLLLTLGLMAWHRHTHRAPVDDAGIIHLRPPVQTADGRAVAQHLDRAERWLTTVNHTTAPLDSTTRAEGEQLLASNAVYLHDARDRGDLPDAAVLDRLGRVLITANHPDEAGLHLRVEMNTDGLLFDLRILRQNQSQPTGDTQ